ncbi:hypothetical protein TPA0906_44640 [Streptomyces olivaceus]|nr:hypothetical protein TPA0906_44640 [Streptomyces olivaceus]
MVKGEDCLHQVGDALGAAVELLQEPPTFEGGHGLLAEAGDLGVGAVVPARPPLEATASGGHLDGTAGALISLAGPALQSGLGECGDDVVGTGGGQVASGAGERG